MNRTFMRIAGAIFLLLSFSAHNAGAQAPALVQGLVRDALERPLASVNLRLQAPDGKTVAQTQSDSEGRFTFSSVGAGTYAVVAEKPEYQSATAIVTMAGSTVTTTVVMAAQQGLDVKITAARLDRARNGLSPTTGSSLYRFGKDDIAALPEGENTAFNQVLLQAPGVANDSYGQLHIRGDHANVQYRINGVILPEGITGFGQALDTRFADKIDLLTGALPAQYGYRTAGVIEIQTKSNLEPGGRFGIYGGSRGTVNPSFEVNGGKDGFNYYVTGSWLHSNIGIENPTGSANPIHDRTDQAKGFAYFSKLLDSTSRVTLMLGTYDGKFQIPNNPNQTPDPDGHGFLAGAGVANFDSASLNERQKEINRYGILSYQSTLGSNFDYQVSLFTRYTSVLFNPDPVGDLVFNGVASRVFRSSFSNGVQADGSMKLNDRHTLRTGVFFSNERIQSRNNSTVFPVDGNGDVNGAAFTVDDNNPKGGNKLFGIYVQDEWRATDRLTINYGLRADHMDAFVVASQLSPRVGGVFQLTPQTTLHAAYSRYFTPPPTELIAPTTIALFQGTSNAPANTGNSAVLPERTHYFDAGVTHKLTPNLSLGADAYYKQVKDLLDEGQFGQALVFTPFNYDKAKIYGLELTANYKKDNVSAYVNWAKSFARATNIVTNQFNFDPAELNFIAKNYVYVDHDQRYTASAGASYRWMGTQYSVNAMYGSGLRAGFANTDKLAPYTQVNLGATRRFDTAQLGKLDARFSIVNLFDKTYEIRDGSGIGVGAPQFGPRRGFYAGVSKVF